MTSSRTAIRKARPGWLLAAAIVAALLAARPLKAQDADGVGLESVGLAPATAALADLRGEPFDYGPVLRTLRRDVARMLTVVRERERQQEKK